MDIPGGRERRRRRIRRRNGPEVWALSVQVGLARCNPQPPLGLTRRRGVGIPEGRERRRRRISEGRERRRGISKGREMRRGIPEGRERRRRSIRKRKVAGVGTLAARVGLARYDPKPPNPASLRDALSAAPCGGAGM